MDSINTAIIDLLWQKPSGTENRVFIPIAETIFYRHRLPLRWYFTSFSGELKRKHKTNCSSNAIAASFIPPDKENEDDLPVGISSGPSKTNPTEEDNQSTVTSHPHRSSSSSCDILAVWFGGVPVDDIPTTSPANPNSNHNGSNPPPSSSAVSNDPLTLDTFLGLTHTHRETGMVPSTEEKGVRFLASKEELNEFLLDPHKEMSGVLQKFIVPKGERNEVLRCTWSTSVTLVEKRTCLAKLNDTKHAAVSARALTYETSGADASAPQSTVRSNYLIAQLQKLSETIVGHVAAVTERRVMISTLTTNWKLDSKDRLVLLWVSGVTVRPTPTETTIPLGLSLHPAPSSFTNTNNSRPSSRHTVGRPKSSSSSSIPSLVSKTVTTKENMGPLDTLPNVSSVPTTRSPSVSPVPATIDENPTPTNPSLPPSKNTAQSTAPKKDKAKDTVDDDTNEVRTEVMNVIRRAHSAATVRSLPNGHPSSSSSSSTSTHTGTKSIEHLAIETLCPPRSSLVTPQGSHTLPLGGINAHKKALKQRDMERIAAQLGKFIVHDPVWECPSCGQVSNAQTLETISLEIIIHHYQAVLSALHLRPRELFARRDSDHLPKECYWPNNVRHVQTIAGGIGIYFAYLMPKNYVRQPITIPYSMGFYLDKWLFQRDISAEVAKASTVSMIDEGFMLPHANYSSLSPPQQRIQELSATVEATPSLESQEALASLIKTTKRAAFDIESAVKLQNEHPQASNEENGNNPDHRSSSPSRRNGPRTLQHLAFGLSPNGLPVVRKIPPSIARAFPEMTVIQYQGFVTNNYTVPGTEGTRTVTTTTAAKPNSNPSLRKNSVALATPPLPYTATIPICGDCFVTYRVFGDSILGGMPDQQALTIAAARFAKVSNKISTNDHSSVDEATNYSHRPGSTRTQNSILHKHRPNASSSTTVQGNSTLRLRQTVTSVRDTTHESKEHELDDEDKVTGSTRSSIVAQEGKETEPHPHRDLPRTERMNTNSIHSSVSSSTIQHYPLLADNKNVLNDIIQTYYNHTNEEDGTLHNTGEYTAIPVTQMNHDHDDTFFMSPDRLYTTEDTVNNPTNDTNGNHDYSSTHPVSSSSASALPTNNQIHPFPSLDSALSADMMSQITDATDMRYYQPSASGMARSQTIDDGDEIETPTLVPSTVNATTGKSARKGSGTNTSSSNGMTNRPGSSSSVTQNKRIPSAANTTTRHGSAGRTTPITTIVDKPSSARNTTTNTEAPKTTTKSRPNNGTTHATGKPTNGPVSKTPRPVSASKAQDIRYRRQQQHKSLHDSNNNNRHHPKDLSPSHPAVPDGDGIIDIDALTLDGDDPDVALATFTMLKKQQQQQQQLRDAYDTTNNGNKGTNRPQTAKPNLGRDSYPSTTNSNVSVPKDTNSKGGSRTTTSSSSRGSSVPPSRQPSRQPTPVQDTVKLPSTNGNDAVPSAATNMFPSASLLPSVAIVPSSSSSLSFPPSQNISRSSSASNLLFNPPSASVSALLRSSNNNDKKNGNTAEMNSVAATGTTTAPTESTVDPLEAYRKDLMQRLSTLGGSSSSVSSVSATLPLSSGNNNNNNYNYNSSSNEASSSSSSSADGNTMTTTITPNNNGTLVTTEQPSNKPVTVPSSVSSSLASGSSSISSRVPSANLTSNSALPSVFQTVLENAMNSFQQSLRSISIASVVGGSTYAVPNNNNNSSSTGSAGLSTPATNGTILANHTNPIPVPLLEANPSANTSNALLSPTQRRSHGGSSSASKIRSPSGRTRTPVHGSRTSTANTVHGTTRPQSRGTVLQFEDAHLSPSTSRATSANTLYSNINSNTNTTGAAYHLHAHSRASTASHSSRPTSTGSFGLPSSNDFYLSNRTRENDIWSTNTIKGSNGGNRLLSPNNNKYSLRPASSHATLERTKGYGSTNGGTVPGLSTVPETYRGEESIHDALSISSNNNTTKIRPYSALPGLGSSSSSTNNPSSLPTTVNHPPPSSSPSLHGTVGVPAPSRYTMTNENYEPNSLHYNYPNPTVNPSIPSGPSRSNPPFLSPSRDTPTNRPVFTSPSRMQGFQVNTGPASLAMMREELRRKEEIEEEKRQAQRSLMRNLSMMARKNKGNEQPISNRTYDRLLGSSAMAMRAARERVANDPSLLQEVLSKATKR